VGRAAAQVAVVSGAKCCEYICNLGRAPAARKLHLNGMNLSHFPASVLVLTALTELSVVANQLPALPDAFFKLVNLTFLDLTMNRIFDLPDTVPLLIRTRTRAHTHTRTRMRTHACTRTRAHAHARTRTHAHAHVDIRSLLTRSNGITQVELLSSLTILRINQNDLVELPEEVLSTSSLEP
jgi:Leucine-rich repeat (LRR) protein